MRDRDDRHLRLVEGIADVSEAEGAHKFLAATIVLSWPARIEDTALGRALVLTTANLISRFCPRVYIAAEGNLALETVALLRRIDQSTYASFRSGTTPPEGATAIVWLGGGLPSLRGTTTAASGQGWIAHIASEGDLTLPIQDASGVPFGTLAAAAFAAAEVFKRLLPPRPGRGHLFPRTSYSVYSYRDENPSADPDVAKIISIDTTLLAGGGAVGQAFAHALSHVPGVEGDLIVVDNETVDDPSNANRYCAVEEADILEKTPKTALAARLLEGTGIRVIPEQRDLAAVLEDIDNDVLPWPHRIVSALDNDSARYALQLLWPDFLVEGATGDTLLQIFRHSHNEGTACLRCIHDLQTGGQRYEETAAETTGLSEDRILRALLGRDTVVTEEDVNVASASVKPLLEKRVGEDLCGVLAEVERFDGNRSAPLQPSVSFTSYLAGLFACAEAVRDAAGLPSGLSGRFQLDPIATLRPSEPWVEDKRPDCYCVERANTIEIYRSQMKARGTGSPR